MTPRIINSFHADGVSARDSADHEPRPRPHGCAITLPSPRADALLMQGFTFIDLFAGIGGTRMGFEAAGGECVFSSERNKYAQQTYRLNHGDQPMGDINGIPLEDIPPHDMLVAGFPCQPFSIAGVSKLNALGIPNGFQNADQGHLFFRITDVLDSHHPRAFLLENVKNLIGHDKGRTWTVIQDALKALGYHIATKVIDAATVVPQHRERIYIVGFRDKQRLNRFSFPTLPDSRPVLRDILERRVPGKYTLTEHLWDYLQAYAEKHRARGNGFGFGLASRSGITRTLSARYYKDGSEILIPQRGKPPRRLTPRECARLMGFPDEFAIQVSDTRAYEQFGNSVVVPVVIAVARAIVKAMELPVPRNDYLETWQRVRPANHRLMESGSEEYVAAS